MIDIINSHFPLIASIFLILNIVKLHKDKQVKGVSISSTAFFALWGFWNLIYYFENGHILSSFSGGFLALCNTIWAFQMIYYSKKKLKVI